MFKKHHRAGFAALLLVLVASVAPAQAASIARQSVWGYVGQDFCVGTESRRDPLFAATFSGGAGFTQDATVTAATQGGSTSVGVAFGPFNLGFAPSPNCIKAYPQNTTPLPFTLICTFGMV
jgi:hypothetical protein